jgi:hypothetical protein
LISCPGDSPIGILVQLHPMCSATKGESDGDNGSHHYALPPPYVEFTSVFIYCYSEEIVKPNSNFVNRPEFSRKNEENIEFGIFLV